MNKLLNELCFCKIKLCCCILYRNSASKYSFNAVVLNIFKTGIDTTTLQIYGDSNCLSSLNSKIRFTQLNQQIIDSLSTDFYNVLIITKTPVNRTYNVISTNESSKLKSYIK